jgi:hypothetical protein
MKSWSNVVVLFQLTAEDHIVLLSPALYGGMAVLVLSQFILVHGLSGGGSHVLCLLYAR